jgi:hypothetical protein
MSIEANLHPVTVDYSLRTYGMYAHAEQIDGSLDLSGQVNELGPNPTILNLGAGPYIGVNALIKTLRPDATLFSLDPGYAYTDTFEPIPLHEEDEAYIRTFTPDAIIPTTGEEIRLAGLAEHMPFVDNSFDFVFGHASVPQNMLPEPGNRAAILGELSRVAKASASITLGLHMTNYEDEWATDVASAQRDGLFTSADIVSSKAYIKSHGMHVHGFRTDLTR